MTYKQVFEELKQQREKYFDLVWYARKGNLDIIQNDAVRRECNRIEDIYSDEVTKLNLRPESDFHHGFNSGMLAAIRLVFDLKDAQVAKDALNIFPDLDT